MRKNKNWNEPIYIIVKFILLWNCLYFVFSRMNFRLLLIALAAVIAFVAQPAEAGSK